MHPNKVPMAFGRKTGPQHQRSSTILHSGLRCFSAYSSFVLRQTNLQCLLPKGSILVSSDQSLLACREHLMVVFGDFVTPRCHSLMQFCDSMLRTFFFKFSILLTVSCGKINLGPASVLFVTVPVVLNFLMMPLTVDMGKLRGVAIFLLPLHDL